MNCTAAETSPARLLCRSQTCISLWLPFIFPTESVARLLHSSPCLGILFGGPEPTHIDFKMKFFRETVPRRNSLQVGQQALLFPVPGCGLPASQGRTLCLELSRTCPDQAVEGSCRVVVCGSCLPAQRILHELLSSLPRRRGDASSNENGVGAVLTFPSVHAHSLLTGKLRAFSALNTLKASWVIRGQ